MTRFECVDRGDNNGGWRYVAYRKDGSYYATNNEGEGLFIINSPPGNVQQLLGTGQFSARSFDQFKRKVRQVGTP